MSVLAISAADYHADAVADQPTLSASIAKILVSASPAHAWQEHPRLNPNYVRKTEDKFQLGTAAHAWLLEGSNSLVIVDAKDWTTKDARKQRDDAQAVGQTVLLGKQWDEVEAMVKAAHEQLAVHEAQPPLFQDGVAEGTLVWEEDGVWLRCRPDWLHNDHATIDDYKTTKASARPGSFERTLYSMNYQIQAAFYRRGVKALLGVDPAFRFCVQEVTPPYVLSVFDLDPAGVALGEDQVQQAIDLWRGCIETGEWPGYDRRVATAELPAWVEAQWMERQDV